MFKHTLALAACLLAAGTAPAAVVGFVESDNGRIDILDDRGPCAGAARHAVYVPRDGSPVGGCWVAGGAMLMIVFFDADIARIPVAAIAPARAT